VATSTLFGYSVEDNDGKLTITVEGAFAEELLRYVREGVKSGKGSLLISQLLPVRALRRLMSASVNITDSQAGTTGPGKALSIEEIFNQGVDQDLDTFEEQLALMRASLDDNKTAAPRNSKAKASRKLRASAKSRSKKAKA
jgi:hypothetical protein